MHALLGAAGQVWPAFVLVTGLLLVGVVAERDGIFAAAGAAIARLSVGAPVLYLTSLGLVAAVTAVLNLDTSVFFLTPVLLHVARTRGLAESPFLYGAVFMSNASSLFLPGSNLTNLIALRHASLSGSAFFVHMLPTAAAAAVCTAASLLAVYSRELRRPAGAAAERPAVRSPAGALAIAASAALVLVLPNPALEVLAVGIVAVVVRRVGVARLREAVGPRVLIGLFALAVLLGGVGRWWDGPAGWVGGLGSWATAGVAAGASVAVNNLPATVLLTPEPPHHVRALLVGLDLGPNLAVTGSLSAFLWLRVARLLGAEPSAARYSLVGLAVVPGSFAAALAVLTWW